MPLKLTNVESVEETQIIDHTVPDNEGKRESSMFCSFCGKGNLEVKKVISGDKAIICDECIELCYSIVEDEKINK